MPNRRRYTILMEVARLTAVLLEDRIDFFRKNFLPRILQSLQHRTLEIPLGELPKWWMTDDPAAPGADERRAEWVMQQVIAADPDRTKKHAQWLLNLFCKGSLQWEDRERATFLLKQFIEKKQEGLVPRNTDLGKFKSLGDLGAFMDQHQQQMVQTKDTEEQQENQQALAQSEVLLNDANWLVVSPKTKFAACYWGRPTDWCTAYGDPKGKHPSYTQNQFEHYAKAGPLFIAIDHQNNARWQFSPASGQFMDSYDRSINIKQWLDEHPEPATALNDYVNRAAKDVTDKLPFKLMENPNAPRRAYVTQTGFQIRTMLFYAKPDFSITVSEDKTIEGVKGSWPSDEENLIWLLRRLKYRGTDSVLTGKGIYWTEEKGYGTFKDVAATTMEFEDGNRWMEAEADTDYGIQGTRLALINKEGQELLTCFLNDEGGFKVNSFDKHSRIARAYPHVLSHLTQLVRDDERIVAWPRFRTYSYEARTINIENLPEHMLRDLVTRKPDMMTPKVMLAINGPSEDTRNRLSTMFEEDGGVDALDWVEIEGKWYAKMGREAKDANDASEEWGDKNFEELAKYIEDGFHDWDFSHVKVDGSDVRDMLDSLTPKGEKKGDPKLLRKIGIAVWQELDEDEQREWLDDNGPTYDPSNPKHIDAAYDLHEVDWLAQAVRWAKSDGERAGAEAQASTAWQEAFTDNPMLWFKGGENGWHKKFEWDTPVALMVPIEKIAEAADEADWEAEWLDGDDKLSVNQPYHGWQDYDEEAAEESFDDHVHDQMPEVADDAQIEYPPDENEEDEDEDEEDEEDEE